MKTAEDCGGRRRPPDTRTFDPDPDAERRLTRSSTHAFAGDVDRRAASTKTCLYTLTPDRDFVLDAVPGHPDVLVALGAAHGFKFASWFGRTLAERAVVGTTPSDITAFRFDRPGITDPTYVPNYMT